MSDDVERRILMLAPTSKDAQLTCKLLADREIACIACESLTALLHEIEQGAGAILFAEEVFVRDDVSRLAEVIARQPAWSDLPVILITRQGADSPAVTEAIATLGNII